MKSDANVVRLQQNCITTATLLLLILHQLLSRWTRSPFLWTTNLCRDSRLIQRPFLQIIQGFRFSRTFLRIINLQILLGCDSCRKAILGHFLFKKNECVWNFLIWSWTCCLRRRTNAYGGIYRRSWNTKKSCIVLDCEKKSLQRKNFY